MRKFIPFLLLVTLIVPSLLDADTIFFKDGSRLDLERVWEEDDYVKYVLYGDVISIPKGDVERIEKSKGDKQGQLIPPSVVEKLKDEIIKSLSSWEVLDVGIKEGVITIRVRQDRLTKSIYTTMIAAGLYNIIYSSIDTWPNIQKIKFINRSKTQGYCFNGGLEELIELTEIPINTVNQYILNKTHEVILEGAYIEPFKRVPMPFYLAIEGDFWIIKDSNIALLHEPLIPPDKQSFQKQVIVLLNVNTKIEVVKNKNSSWKEVFVINEENNRSLRGWVLTSTVKSAYKIQR